jgi:hypothetical protein
MLGESVEVRSNDILYPFIEGQIRFGMRTNVHSTHY